MSRFARWWCGFRAEDLDGVFGVYVASAAPDGGGADEVPVFGGGDRV